MARESLCNSSVAAWRCRQLALDKHWGHLSHWIFSSTSAALLSPTSPTLWSGTSTSCSTHLPFPSQALLLPHSALWPPCWLRRWAAATALCQKQKHLIYLQLYSSKGNKHHPKSLRYINEQLLLVTMGLLSSVAFSLPLCYSHDKPTYATGLKTDCKQPEQKLSHLVSTRPTTMEPLSCLQTSSTAIIQILLKVMVNVA